MNAVWVVLALLSPQEDEGLPKPRGEQDLRRKIDDLEKRLERIDRKIRESRGQDDADSARRYNQEHKETEQEIEKHRRELDELKSREPKRREWYENVNLEALGLATHWDRDLELDDGAGWGAAVYVRDFLFLGYRRWDPDDDLGDDDATVSSYEAGFTYEFGLEEEKRSAFILGGALGLIRFTSDAPGAHGDTGSLYSLRPQWKFYFSPQVRLNTGADIDIARTSFNQNRTHTNHTFSLFLSIEFAF